MIDGKYALTYHELEDLIDLVTEEIDNSGFQPEIIVGVARGGLVPAVALSHYYDADLVPVHVSFYHEAYRIQKLVSINDDVSSGTKILVVDDINDSGRTFSVIRSMIGDHGNVKYASLFVRHSSRFNSDFSGQTLQDDRWIVFPWEVC